MKPKNYFLCAILTMATMFTLNAQVYFQPPPVGAIPGAIDVSPTGAATYSIPIEVVPGTQGMQPNLSIVYNSMGGMGLLGMKWNLAGLSAITRCGRNIYSDNNETSSIKFNDTDRFVLDGNRLISLEGIYGADGTIYATEMEDFSRIVSAGDEIQTLIPFPLPPHYITTYVTTHFTAYTDDGNVIEYGHTTDSKQKLGTTDNSVLSWYVNKITDANGNYMTFTYGNSNNEIWIQSIEYTGNGTMQPYAKVEFSYTTLPNTILWERILILWVDTEYRKPNYWKPLP